MKFLREHIKEEIERAFMPQVSFDDQTSILQRLDDLGVGYDSGAISCDKLHPMQDGINREKVDSMKNNLKNGKDLGFIFIAKDGGIVDGHHRWMATKEVHGPTHRIQACMLNLPSEKAIQLMNYIVQQD